MYQHDFCSDAGHGWLKVTTAELLNLKIYGEISSYSHVLGDDVYLEEDCDAPTFVRAYETQYGLKPAFKSVDHGALSPIRGYDRFKGH